MPSLQKLKQYIRRKYIFVRFHKFSLLITSFLIAILVIGILTIDNNLVISAGMATILLAASVTYYLLYFRRFRELIDAESRQQYYFDIYSFSDIIIFNVLFIFCFALIGTVIDRCYTGYASEELFGNPLFTVGQDAPYQVSYTAMLLYLFQVTIDNGSFDLLSALGIELYEIPTGLKLFKAFEVDSSEFRWIDLSASVLVYIASLVINIAFWTSVFNELGEWLQVQGVEWLNVKSEVSELFKSPVIDPDKLSSYEIKRNKEILRRVEAEEIDIKIYETKLFRILKTSKSIEVIDLFLYIMEKTENLCIFEDCLSYFKNVQDRRFNATCERIRRKDSGKERIIKNFEFQQIKKQRWRGRSKRSSPN
jgi:hypothetical protein